MKIYEKICDIQSEIDYIGKDQKNSQQGFKYRGIDQVYNDVHALLAKHRVFSFPLSIENESTEREGRTGILRFTIAKITYRFCADDGSYLDVTVLGESMDSGDKSCGKAMSYAHKYAFFQLFSIPTDGDNDPDATTHELAARHTPQTKSSEVSDAQAKRAFAIASSKGISGDMLKSQVKKVCGSDDIKKLTRVQYNTLCERLEAYQQAKESVSSQYGEAITNDQLADIYEKVTGCNARTLQLNSVFEWAESKKNIFHLSNDGTLHLKMKYEDLKESVSAQNEIDQAVDTMEGQV